MHTQNQDHQIPKTNKAGCFFGIAAKTRGALRRVGRKNMAVFGIADALRGVIDTLLGRLPIIRRSGAQVG